MSSGRHPFALVDVFTDVALRGNPLAVVTGADDLSDDVMRAVAKETNQVETTFVLRPRSPSATARLRSFTAAGAEVGGAGHNSLGAWWWLAASGAAGPEQTSEILQEIGDAVLPVGIGWQDGQLTSVSLRQQPPVFGPAPADVLGLAAALGVPAAALDARRSRVVSTGAAHLMLAVRQAADLERLSPEPLALRAELARAGAEGCYVYAFPGSDARRPHARFLNPTVGITEDIATGTAAGPLAAHLVSLGLVDDGSTVLVSQGAHVGRPSLLEVLVTGERVELRGRCAVSVAGWLQL